MVKYLGQDHSESSAADFVPLLLLLNRFKIV
jgi:hypothetical protein